MSENKEYNIVNSANEIIDKIYEGDKILRKKSIEYLNNIIEWNLEQFFKGNIDEIHLLLEELSNNEAAMLLRIAPYVGYEDCCLKYKNGNPLGTEALIKLSKSSRPVALNTIKLLCEKDIICRGKNSKERLYFVNPWIFCKGNRINKVLKTMFRNYRVRVVNKKWKDIKD